MPTTLLAKNKFMVGTRVVDRSTVTRFARGMAWGWIVFTWVATSVPLGSEVSGQSVPDDFSPSGDALAEEIAKLEDPPPRNALRYPDRGRADYDVTITVGGNDGETYSGTLAYNFQGNGRVQVEAQLNEKGPRGMPSGRYRISLPGMRDAGPDHFETISANATLVLDSRGTPDENNRTEQLNLLLGDYLTLPLILLPSVESAESVAAQNWELQDAVMTTRYDPSDPLSRMPMPFLRARGSDSQPALEAISYAAEPASGETQVIRQRYMLDATKLDPPSRLDGTGVIQFDRIAGVPTSVKLDRTLSGQRNGAEIRFVIRLEMTLKDQIGLRPYTGDQKRQLARSRLYAASPEGIAERKRMEAERDARLEKLRLESQAREDAKKQAALKTFMSGGRDAALAKLRAATDYGGGAGVLGELRGIPERPDAELAKALLDLANRIELVGLSRQFYEMAAKFDPDFAPVWKQIYDLRQSHSKIETPGPAVRSGSALRPNQLVLIPARYGDAYEPRQVVSIDGGAVTVRRFGSSQSEKPALPIETLRFPPKNLTSYLSESLRGVAASSRQDLAMQVDGGSDHRVEPSGAAAENNASTSQWADETGKFKIEADFVKLDGSTLYLQKPDGTNIRVPMSRLDEASRRQAEAAAKQALNPFEAF